MIFTCSHRNFIKSNTECFVFTNCEIPLKPYAISNNGGQSAVYKGDAFPILAPPLSMWKTWYDNKNHLSKEENDKSYIEKYYQQVLSKLDPEEIYRELNNSILLCYENNDELCHRHVVAAWFELLYGVRIPEIKTNLDGIIEEIDRPEYIKEYLEDIIKQTKNMRGFESLEALYIYERAEKFDVLAQKSRNGKERDYYIEAANKLRSDANDVDAKYRQERFQKVKK